MGQRLFRIPAKFIVAFFSSPEMTFQVADDPLPAGTRVLGVWADPREGNTFLMKIEHPEWGDVPEGDAIPFVREPTVQCRHVLAGVTPGYKGL